mgnify:CR=1 FL=1
MGVPNLYIIGAPKCGTTSLCHYLAQHPKIYLPERKEPYYLANDLNWVSGWGVTSQLEYEALYNSKRKYQIDASTWYLYSRSARKVLSEIEGVKIIICLRHPVNFMESLWWHMRSRGKDTSKNLKKSLVKEIDIKNGSNFRPAPHARAIMYRENANFAKYVKLFLDEFSPSQIKIIFLEDLSLQLDDTMTELFSFLDLKPLTENRKMILNESFDGKYLSLRTLLNYSSFTRNILSDKRYNSIRVCMKKSLQLLNLHRPVKRIRLSYEEWETLTLSFSDEIKELSTLVNKDLEHWLSGYNSNI